MKEFNYIKETLMSMSTTNVSDALDALGINNNAVAGIRPVWDCPAIVGIARTVRSLPAGGRKQQFHGSVLAAQSCRENEIIVIGNNGDVENNSWGEVVTCIAMQNGAVGCVSDGAVRDIAAIKHLGFPVYSKGVTPRTGRGRMVLDAINVNIRFGNTQVSPGDIVFADSNGVVFIPRERVFDTLAKAKEIVLREGIMMKRIMEGGKGMDICYEGGYETMIQEL